MKSLYPQLRLTDSSFNYTPAAKTDIRDTFRRFTTGGLQNNKPLVGSQNNNFDKPLVDFSFNPGGFVLPAEWFEILG